MKHTGSSVFAACFLGIATACVLFVHPVLASTAAETTLLSFSDTNGANSTSPVLFDEAGNLYGTTNLGGQFGNGTVFELSPPTVEGGAWSETILHSFAGDPSDGTAPNAIVLDSKGALFGTTLYGGHGDSGTVFKLTPPAAAGDPWTETIVYGFCPSKSCTDGKTPVGSLVFDREGNLYGATSGGGDLTCRCGVVFRLSPPQGDPVEKSWTETVLYAFLGNSHGQSDGSAPESGVIFDRLGNLYGTTFTGGPSTCRDGGCGTVYQLTPPSSGSGSWSESLLYSFQGEDGQGPVAGVIFDKSGNLYGTTTGDDGNFIPGNVFQLTPPGIEGAAWTESVLYTFRGIDRKIKDGSNPVGGLIFNAEDALVGTTGFGGSSKCTYGNKVNVGCGTVFELSPESGGGWTKKIIWNFASGGQEPQSSLTLHEGAYYGTTFDGSGGKAFCQFGCGAVFELTP